MKTKSGSKAREPRRCLARVHEEQRLKAISDLPLDPRSTIQTLLGFLYLPDREAERLGQTIGYELVRCRWRPVEILEPLRGAICANISEDLGQLNQNRSRQTVLEKLEAQEDIAKQLPPLGRFLP